MWILLYWMCTWALTIILNHFCTIMFARLPFRALDAQRTFWTVKPLSLIEFNDCDISPVIVYVPMCIFVHLCLGACRGREKPQVLFWWVTSTISKYFKNLFIEYTLLLFFHSPTPFKYTSLPKLDFVFFLCPEKIKKMKENKSSKPTQDWHIKHMRSHKIRCVPSSKDLT